MTLTKYNAAGEVLQDEARFAPGGIVCQAYISTQPSLANNALIPYNLEGFDPFGWYDTVASRFTPKVPGYYKITATAHWANPGSGTVAAIAVRKNGNAVRADYSHAANAVNGIETCAACVVYLNGTTDYVDAVNFGGATRSVYTDGSSIYTAFEAELVAASVGVAPEPRHLVGAAGEPAWTNGWASESGYLQVGFWKDPHGIVHLQGEANGVSASAAAALTLPVGYRPGGALLSISKYFPAGANPMSIGECSIGTTGVVSLLNNNEAFASNMRWYTVDARFRAEQ